MGFFSRINPVNLIEKIRDPVSRAIVRTTVTPWNVQGVKSDVKAQNLIGLSTLPHGVQSKEARTTHLGMTHNNQTGVAVGAVVATWYGGPEAGSLVAKIGSAKIQKDVMDEAADQASLLGQGAGSNAVNSARKPVNGKAFVGIGVAAVVAKLLIFS
jgi:hypothetical protein